MKLEPVYLVAPRPRITTRRAYLIAACAGVGGLAVGWIGGWIYNSGVRVNAGELPSPRLDRADGRLALALRLSAPQTPLAELLANDALVLMMVHETEAANRPEPRLWDAVQRLARAVAENPRISARARRATALVDLLGSRAHPLPWFDEVLPALRAGGGR